MSNSLVRAVISTRVLDAQKCLRHSHRTCARGLCWRFPAQLILCARQRGSGHMQKVWCIQHLSRSAWVSSGQGFILDAPDSLPRHCALPACIFNIFFQGNFGEKYRRLRYTCLIISIAFHLTVIPVALYWMSKMLCRVLQVWKSIGSLLHRSAQPHKGWRRHKGRWLGISSVSSTCLDLLEPTENISPSYRYLQQQLTAQSCSCVVGNAASLEWCF